MEQHTLGASINVSGIGLHSGKETTVTLNPAPENYGRCFVLPDRMIPADVKSLNATVLSTEIGGIRTVEHLLSALWGMGIDNVEIKVEGEEIPILDGSALPWVEKIQQVGILAQGAKQPPPILTNPIYVQESDRFVMALPSPQLRFTYGIEFPTKAIGVQWFSWAPNNDYAEMIAPARTFTLESQITQLRSMGLIQGGSLDNALVCNEQEWLNPPLRFPEEPCRHKLLDLIGDLSLAGVLPQAHFVAYKASHNLHGQFAQALVTNYGKN